MFFQDQRENHKRAITALSQQLKDTLKELREKTKEKKEAELGWKKENKERAFEEGKLRDNLQKRDKLIEVNISPYCRCVLMLETTGCYKCNPLLTRYFFGLPFIASSSGVRGAGWRVNRATAKHL